MADPIIAQNVLIQFQDTGDWFNYACAKEVTVEFSMETKSVKTVGDGNWDKLRGQKKKYTINLTGVVKFDDSTVPHVFDLYDAFDGMTSIPFRIVFSEPETGLIKYITGDALPTSVTLGGGSEGHAEGDATLEGDGAPTIADSIAGCSATLGTFTATGVADSGSLVFLNFTTGVSSDCVRVDWSVDGGARDSFFPTATGTPFGQYISPVSVGTHTITFYPVCLNGEDGVSQSKSVTVS